MISPLIGLAGLWGRMGAKDRLTFATISTSVIRTYCAIEPGTGPVPAAQFEVQHRAVGSETWISEIVPAANGGITIYYADGWQVELRVRGISAAYVTGPWSATATITVMSSP